MSLNLLKKNPCNNTIAHTHTEKNVSYEDPNDYRGIWKIFIFELFAFPFPFLLLNNSNNRANKNNNKKSKKKK